MNSTYPFAKVNTNRNSTEIMYDLGEIKWEDMNNYVIHGKIGRGKYLHVLDGTDKRTGKRVTIKVLIPIKKQKIKRQYHILRILDHPNIVKFIEIVQCPYLRQTSFIEQYVPHVDFRELYPELSLGDNRIYMKQLFQVYFPQLQGSSLFAFEWYNTSRYQTIQCLIDPISKSLKIIDFGLSDYYIPDKQNSQYVASLYYKASELPFGNPWYDYRVDIWNAGMIMAGMIFKKTPFVQGNDFKDQVHKIIKLLGIEEIVAYIKQYKLAERKGDSKENICSDTLKNYQKEKKIYKATSFTEFQNNHNQQNCTWEAIDLIKNSSNQTIARDSQLNRPKISFFSITYDYKYLCMILMIIPQQQNRIFLYLYNGQLIINLMLFTRKIFNPKILQFRLALPLLGKNSVYLFSTPPIHRKQLQQLHSKLIMQNQKLNPDAVIKMLHFLHFKSQQIQQATILKDNEIQQIVSNLSGNIFRFNHEQLTLLLQAISQFPKYQYYNRNNDFMKLLLKRLNSIQVITLQNQYIFRFLNVLQKMRFPPMIISKFVNTFINKADIKKRGEQPMSQLDCLRLFIAILEMSYIPIAYVAKFYEKQIKKMHVTHPKQLCYLYYIYRTLQKSIQLKFAYFSNKLRLHQLVFNPYSHLTEANENNQHKEIKEKEDTQQTLQNIQNAEQRQKQNMRNSAAQLIADMKKQVDLEKLKNQICKLYDFERYPFETATALLVNDIPQLKTSLKVFFNKQYQTMQPIQFVNLLSIIPLEQRRTYYDQYLAKVWKLLQLEDKLLLLKANLQVCQSKIDKNQILKLLQQAKSINTKQFQLITAIITQSLTPEDQLQILKAIQKLTDDGQTK